MANRLTSMIDTSRITNIVRDLVRIPSVNPPGEERAVAEYLFNLLDGWGL